MGKKLSFPRKRESKSLKLLLSPNDWMPASAGMANYETVYREGGIGWGDRLTKFQEFERYSTDYQDKLKRKQEPG